MTLSNDLVGSLAGVGKESFLSTEGVTSKGGICGPVAEFNQTRGKPGVDRRKGSSAVWQDSKRGGGVQRI